MPAVKDKYSVMATKEDTIVMSIERGKLDLLDSVKNLVVNLKHGESVTITVKNEGRA